MKPDGMPPHSRIATDEFRALTRQAQLPPIRRHDLRHRTATHALAGGVDLKSERCLIDTDEPAECGFEQANHRPVVGSAFVEVNCFAGATLEPAQHVIDSTAKECEISVVSLPRR